MNFYGNRCDPELAAPVNRRALTPSDLEQMVDDAAEYAGQANTSAERAVEVVAGIDVSLIAVEESVAQAETYAQSAQEAQEGANSSAGEAATQAANAGASAASAAEGVAAAQGYATSAQGYAGDAQATAQALNAAKGRANGIAPLDGSSKLPEVNVPTRLTEQTLGATIGSVAATAAGTSGAGLNQTIRKTRRVTPLDFGAVGGFDSFGIPIDETAAIQQFLDYVVDNGVDGYMNAKLYSFSQTLQIKNKRGWELHIPCDTEIRQLTDNIPIVNMGVGGESSGSAGFRDWYIFGGRWTYANVQTATMTNATAFNFVGMGYEARMVKIYVQRAHYAFRTAPGQVPMWGMTLDDIHVGPTVSGGFLDWTGTSGAIPNNVWGRIFIEANQMIGPIFKNWRGYANWTAAVEIINANQSPQIASFAAGAKMVVGSLKIEGATYTVGRSLFDVAADVGLRISYFFIGGGALNVNLTGPERVRVFNVGSGGGNATLDIGILEAKGSGTPVTNAFLFGGNQINNVHVGSLIRENGWLISPIIAGDRVAEAITIDTWTNNRDSPNRGDADLGTSATPIQPGLNTEQFQFFETAFTSPRSIYLPTDTSSLVAGLEYEVYVKGAINGSNTLAIRAGARTVLNQTTDSVVIRLRWRRMASGANGWTVMGITPIP